MLERSFSGSRSGLAPINLLDAEDIFWAVALSLRELPREAPHARRLRRTKEQRVLNKSSVAKVRWPTWWHEDEHGRSLLYCEYSTCGGE